MSKLQQLYTKTSGLPQGKRLFALAYSQAAPYFASIHMQNPVMEKHRGELTIPLRRATKNHIGTVHAIAVCNGLEAAMGMLAEATTPKGHRWLPKGMNVEYLAKSNSAIVCTATTTEADWANLPDVPVTVTARRKDGTVVVQGTITIYVTPNKK